MLIYLLNLITIQGDFLCVQYLLKHSPPEVLKLKDINRDTPEMLAKQQNSMDVIKLFEEGVDQELTPFSKMLLSLLRDAASYDNQGDMIMKLLDEPGKHPSILFLSLPS